MVRLFKTTIGGGQGRQKTFLNINVNFFGETINYLCQIPQKLLLEIAEMLKIYHSLRFLNLFDNQV